MDNKALLDIIERHKTCKDLCYMQVIAFDDKKKDKRVKEKFFDLRKTSSKEIKNQAEIFNEGTFGVYITTNPLTKALRRKENVEKYFFIFIDLDDAKEEHKETIKIFLEKNNIKYSYIGVSGNGFHFLIPVEIESEKQNIVKSFLYYLKNNICDKVDISTNDPTRIFRFPESYHNKGERFRLKTLYSEMPNNDEIILNNELVLKFQYEKEDLNTNLSYLENIEKEDSFFSIILNNKNNWKLYFSLLNKHDNDNEGIGNNQIFNKNLSIFCVNNPQYKDLGKDFIKQWKNKYVTIKRFECFMSKVSKESLKKDNNGIQKQNKVSYLELFKWAKTYNLDIFKQMLKKHLKSSFLDNYEFYYLEDEKPDYAYLLYYPEKKYYVQKNLQGLKDALYYEAKELGVDLVKLFGLNLVKYGEKNKDWEDINFQQQLNIIRNSIHSYLEKENRIRKVFNINYKPTDEKFIIYEDKKFFNIYRKTDLLDFYNKKEDYNFKYIKELLLNLCGNDIKSYDYFNKWLGWQIKNPTEKLPTAIIFQGAQGSGKGVLKNFILDNIFGNNIQEINQTHLESSFNEYLLGKQIIIANEVIHNENKSLLPNVLKNLVTDPKITIQRKFKKELEGYNYSHWIFCTNSENPLKIDEDDRRYSVFYSKKLKDGGKKAVKFVKNLINNLDYELKEYISYLKSLSIKYDEVHEPLMTEAKKQIQYLNKDSIDKFLEFIQQFNTLYELYYSINGNDDKYLTLDFGSEELFVLTDNFFLIYRRWAEKYGEKGIFNKQNFSRRLSNYDCNSIPKKKKTIDTDKYRSFRVYKLSDIEKLMEVKE